jgi:rod shape-determining protein MreD
MSEQSYTRVWGMRLTFVLVVCVILFFLLLPLETTPRRWVGPDLILGFACAWSLRRPEYVPLLWLAGLFLLVDMLLQRPPGLWALCALLGCEHLKNRARSLRDSPFLSEWITVSVIISAIALAYRAGLMVTFTDPPSFGLTLIELIMTIAFYPFAVAVTHGLLGVRKAGPGQLDAGGGRAG